MGAGIFNMSGDAAKIEAGSTYDKTVPVIDALGAPLDFSVAFPVADAAMHMRLEDDSLNGPLLALGAITSGQAALGQTGIYVDTTPNAGTIRIVISAEDSSAMSFDVGVPIPENRSGVYQLEIYDGGSPPRSRRVLQGTYAISPENVR